MTKQSFLTHLERQLNFFKLEEELNRSEEKGELYKPKQSLLKIFKVSLNVATYIILILGFFNANPIFVTIPNSIDVKLWTFILMYFTSLILGVMLYIYNLNVRVKKPYYITQYAKEIIKIIMIFFAIRIAIVIEFLIVTIIKLSSPLNYDHLFMITKTFFILEIIATTADLSVMLLNLLIIIVSVIILRFYRLY